MRAVCNTETFGKKLALVSRGVSARSTIQLLGGILLEAGDGVVRLSSTDMEISVQTSSPAEVEEEGGSSSRPGSSTTSFDRFRVGAAGA